MNKILLLVGCLMMVVNAGTYGGKKIGLEDIERDNNSNQKTITNIQPKGITMAVPSPTKFGYVPKRTASSYAATNPKTQYLQTHYRVKQPSYQAQPSQYQQQYTTAYTQPQPTYQQQYSSVPTQQYASPSSASSPDYAVQFSFGSQQYVPQQQAQEYAYVQPEVQQQYAVDYQQPGQQYEQYENVQYISDNSIAKAESQPQQYSQAPQPQYYYVQQYQSPSAAVESVIDPKTFQYVFNLPSYASNSIPIDQKQLEAYSTSSEAQLPPVTTTVAKYTKVIPSKGSSSKQYNITQKDIQYVLPSAKTQYYKPEDILFKREPKSLLDSYVPSIVQMQYLRQQGKSVGYTKF